MVDIVILVFVGTLGGLLLPAAKDSGMRKVFSFAVGLCVLLAICRPIAAQAKMIFSLPEQIAAHFFSKTEELETAEENARIWVIRYSTENIEAGVSKLVENRYSLNEGSVRTEAVTEMDSGGNLILKKLVLYIDSAEWISKADAARFISDMLACPCEVSGDDGGKEG